MGIIFSLGAACSSLRFDGNVCVYSQVQVAELNSSFAETAKLIYCEASPACEAIESELSLNVIVFVFWDPSLRCSPVKWQEGGL